MTASPSRDSRSVSTSKWTSHLASSGTSSFWRGNPGLAKGANRRQERSTLEYFILIFSFYWRPSHRFILLCIHAREQKGYNNFCMRLKLSVRSADSHVRPT